MFVSLLNFVFSCVCCLFVGVVVLSVCMVVLLLMVMNVFDSGVW